MYQNTKKTPAPDLVRPYAVNKKQMADIMGISLSTLKRQIKGAQLEVGRGLISPSKQRLVYEALGWLEKS